MANFTERKCNHCKKAIHIDRNDIRDVLMFKNKYYHNACFVLHVQQKLAGKRVLQFWKDALSQIDEFERDAKKTLEYCFNRDDLYDHLLNHYDVVSIPSSVFTRIDAVLDGEYGIKSKPIDYADFVSCWKFGQKRLDKIAADKRKSGHGINGVDRINYDLAIVVRKFPQWKKKQEMLRAEREDLERAQKEAIRINYNSMQRTEIKHEGLDDISALLDEF
jgi:hypothetical protein